MHFRVLGKGAERSPRPRPRSRVLGSFRALGKGAERGPRPRPRPRVLGSFRALGKGEEGGPRPRPRDRVLGRESHSPPRRETRVGVDGKVPHPRHRVPGARVRGRNPPPSRRCPPPLRKRGLGRGTSQTWPPTPGPRDRTRRRRTGTTRGHCQGLEWGATPRSRAARARDVVCPH